MRAVVLAVLVALAGVALATPAEAAPSGEVTACATAHESNLIRYNDTRRETQAMLDGPGRHPTIGINHEVIQREYRLCGRRWDHGRLIVRYSRATDRVRLVLWLEVSGGTLDRESSERIAQ